MASRFDELLLRQVGPTTFGSHLEEIHLSRSIVALLARGVKLGAGASTRGVSIWVSLVVFGF
jgi:hypothetical protein